MARKKKNVLGSRRAFGDTLTKFLNIGDGEDPPDEKARREIDHDESPAVLDPAEIERLLATEIEYDPEAPVPLQDPDVASACRDNLRLFADSWIDAQYGLHKWTRKPELEEGLRSRDPLLIGGTGTPATLYLATRTSGDADEDGRAYAVWLFYKLITSQLFDRLARCSACGKYYIARRKGPEMVYCSPECGSNTTSKASMRKRRAQEHASKLAAVRATLADFNDLNKEERSNWKKVLAQRATIRLKGPLPRKPIKDKFITRAINRGELKPPAGASMTRRRRRKKERPKLSGRYAQ